MGMIDNEKREADPAPEVETPGVKKRLDVG